MRISLNRGWSFTEHFDEAFLKGENSCDVAEVDLPHTCRETPYNYFDDSAYQMVCGYRQIFLVPKEWAGKRVFLVIGAAGHSADVYVDGRKLAEHHCGYTSFSVELTGALTPGKEVSLVIRVNSREDQDIPPFGYVIDYMTYGGLYREAWLEIKEQSFIADVFAMPALSGELACHIALEGDTRGSTLLQRVLDEGAVIAEECFYAAEETKMSVPGIRPWDVDDPKLYTLETLLLRNDTILDRAETRIGFREAVFRTDGFYLNGRKIKLRGLNRHQSYPYAGYAMPASVQRYDADILKNELGCNIVRTSHYPQSPHFIDRCDELGLLVFTEIPGWQHIGGEAWKDQAVHNVEEMVLQYRNHPSIVLWGVRINESQDDDALYTRTNALAHALDPTRQTGGVRCITKSILLEDVYTYNDFIHDGKAAGCQKKQNVTSDVNKPYMVTEYNGHMFPTKAFDPEEHLLEHAVRHAAVLDAIAAEEDIAGSTGWCMFDYNTHKDFGSGDRICYHGVLDMFRNHKPAADVYASQGLREPVLSISTSMNIGEHPSAFRGRVLAFTNADSVRMYRNGSFIREFKPEDSAFPHLPHPPLEIDDFIGNEIAEKESFAPKQAQFITELINYASRFGYSHLPASLKWKMLWLKLRYGMKFSDANALYNKYTNNWGDAAAEYRFDAILGGNVVSSVTKAAVKSIHLQAEASRYTLVEEETYDAALIRITMRDQNGNLLPFYQEAVTLKTEGPLRLIGPAEAMLRGGMGGTFVRTAGGAGNAALTLEAPGALPVKLSFNVECRHANTIGIGGI